MINELPEQAIEEVVSWCDNGEKRFVNFRVDGEIVWQRQWAESGQLIFERGVEGDFAHGPQRSWHDNGQLADETFFIHGKEHGLAHQYDYEGNLIGTYTMDHGTGLDQWYQSAGVLSEERQYQEGYLHGFERWYSSDGTIYLEGHFKQGEKHGIFREWNNKGGLSRGFPQYFVNGARVAKRRYLTACKRDNFLPPYRIVDNDFHRQPLASPFTGLG